MDYPKTAQWYLNNELMENPKYVKDFVSAWNDKWLKKTLSSLEEWERLKAWIRDFTQQWVKDNKASKNEELKYHNKMLKRFKKTTKKTNQTNSQSRKRADELERF